MSGIVLDALDDARWRRVEQVLDAVLELDPSEVPAHLARACSGDDALRRQVEALLEADRGAQGFLRVPAIERLPSLTIPDEFRPAATASLLVPAHPECPPPARVGRYAVLEELGRGGMGIVYLGRDEALGRTVAIKALPEPVAAEPDRLSRFLAEAKSLGALHHPNIAAIHGVEHSAGRRYLILEHIEGTTLSELLRSGPLSIPRALDACAQIAEALAAAHSQGIVHRDLKPGNLMITPGGLVKVLDFGLAKHAAWTEPGAATPRSPAATECTRTGAQLGTPGFMSPEQILDQPQDARADLFALGCVLYQTLTGVRAFAGGSVGAVFSATLSGIVDMTRLPAPTPEGVRRLLIRMLEKDPESRLADAREAAAVLGGAGARMESTRNRDALPDPRPARAAEAVAPFVGRTREIDAGIRLLARERLVTLTGPGGAGKSRLAVEIARTWSARRDATRVWFADLGTAHDSAGVVAALAAALDVRDPTPTRLVDALVRDADLGPGLLVIDHCEPALAPCAALVAELLATCDDLRVLAASREWLGVTGEQTLRVPPLALPDPEVAPTAASTASAESVRLFLACAKLTPRGFTLTDANAPLVAALCSGLDGVPLAIELTAALLRDRSLESIAAELDHRLHRDMISAASTGPLQAAFQLSYDRLAVEEQRMFRALSVFAGGWSLESAAYIGGFGDDEFAALDLLTRLVDASLVTIQRSGGAEPRYRFLEPIRQFAIARREATHESPALLARHVECFLAAGERIAPALTSRTDQPGACARLDADHANVLAALRACETLPEGAVPALRLVGAVWMFWYVRGHFALGREALARALALPGAAAPTPARAQALFAAGGLAVFQGDYGAGRRLNGAALELFREHDDALGMARSLNHLALCDGGEGRFDAARRSFRDAIEIFERLGDTRRSAVAMNNLGVVERQQGDYPSARATFEATLERVRLAGDRDSMIVTLVNLALVSARLGAVDEAARWIREALAHVAALGAKRAGAAALETAAEILAARGRCPEAASLLGAASALREAIGLEPDAWWRKSLRTLTERVRTTLGGETFEHRAQAGARRRFDDSVADARRWSTEANSAPEREPEPPDTSGESAPVSKAPPSRSGT